MYQYSHRIWQKKDGLPQNSVHAIVQTCDGYLWFGTDEGLARFDGLQFKVFNLRNTPQFKSNQVRALCEGNDSTLWIVFADWGGIVSYRNGKFSSFATNRTPFIPSSNLHVFCDSKGMIWFSSFDGLLRFNPKDTSSLLYTMKQGLPFNTVTSSLEDTTGAILASTRQGLSIFEHGRFRLHPSVQFPIRALCRDKHGAIWFAGKFGIARLNSDSSVTTYGVESGFPLSAAGVNSIYEDRVGTLWIATAGSGLYRFADGKFSSFTVADGLSSSFAESVFEDAEGNLWIGTTGGGLNRLTNTKFTTYLPSTGPTMVWSVYEDRTGAIWAGNETGSLLRLEKGRLVQAFDDSSLRAGAVMAVLLDRQGVLWSGGRSGIYRIHNWKKRVLTKSDYTFYQTGLVSAITEDAQGGIWAGTIRGLFHYNKGVVTNYTKEQGLGGNNDVRVVHQDRKGDLWMCMSAGGITRLHNGAFIVYDSKGYPNAPEGPISMCEDSSGTMWFGTLASGLVRWNGEKFSALRYAQNIYDESIFSIQEDRLGHLWMSSNNGVFRVSKQELNDVCDGRRPSMQCTVYGMSDGMKSDECNGGFMNSGCTSRTGSMWFPTTIGLVMVTPANLPLNRIPPSVVIESFSADKKTIEPASEIEIGPGAGVLEFTFTGLSYMASDKVRFRVLLEGFDAEWTDVGKRRYVSYTNIPPGRYRFRVTASNNDGVWNETGASMAFVLKPHFYQTSVFYLLTIGFIAFSGAVTHKFYRRAKDRTLIQSRRQAQLEARLKESQLNSLSMQLQPHFLFNTLNSISSLMHFDVDKADRMVAHLGDLLRMSLARVKRQEVPLKQELEFLESYLCIEQARLDNRLCVERHIDAETLNALVPSMLWQPLVENAIKHGIAPRRTPGLLTLGARRIGSELELTIQDNGEGVDREFTPGASNGVGLRNTQERLELLYPHRHEIRFSNNPEGGVTVTLRIPFRIEEYEADTHS